MNIRAASLVLLVPLVLPACKAKSGQPAPTASASAASAAIPTKPTLPPEPAPPLADKAGDVPGLEAALAADKAFQAIWAGPRADLNAFLSFVSEAMANSGATVKQLGDSLRAKKTHDAAVKLVMIFPRTGKLPADFTAKLAAHLETTKAEPHLGTWAPPAKGVFHDYSALAAWSRPEDAMHLREHIAAKKDGAGPFRWEPWTGKEPPRRPWLVEEGAALERLSLLTTLTGDELERRQALRAVAKKEVDAKKDEASAVRVTAAELFTAYEANEVSADERFKGKALVVSGTVSAIDKGGLSGEAILLKLSTANQFTPVTASMEDEEKPKTMKLAKGDQVKLLCSDGAVKVLGLIQVQACVVR